MTWERASRNSLRQFRRRREHAAAARKGLVITITDRKLAALALRAQRLMTRRGRRHG